MIDVEELVRRYPKGTGVVEVLRGVTFHADAGEFIAIMGRSGSGKSTLLNILGLLDRPDGGQYLLEGIDFAGADDDTLSGLRSRKIGFVFQQFHLLERTSALRNVMLPFLYTEHDVPDAEVRARRALDAVGLADRADHTPAELSGGEQQRVAIARALANDPPLLLADEPTGNLDSASAGDVLRILSGLRQAGRTVILVTHDAAVAAAADRILTLDEGRIRGAPAAADRSVTG